MLAKYDRLHTSLRQQASNPSVQWDHPFPRGLYLSSCPQDVTSWLFIVDLLKLSAVTRSNPHPIIFLESCSQVAVEIFKHISLENYSTVAGANGRELRIRSDLGIKNPFPHRSAIWSYLPSRFRHKHILVIQKRRSFSRWWQLKYFLCSSRTLGKMDPNLTQNFPNGWVETTNYSCLFQKNSRLLDGVSIEIPKGLAC